MERLTGSSARLGSYYVSPKANDKLYYVATSPDGRSLYERNLKGRRHSCTRQGSERMGYDS